MRLGLADETGVRGPRVRHLWSELEIDPRRRIPWRRLFAEPFAAFRRLDPLSRFCCLAVEAAGIDFDEERRQETALVLATTLGCLASDRRFARSLEGIVEPAVFPYTLPSTALGDLAIRHRLRGPNLCLTTAAGGEGEAFDEARLLLAGGEAAAAVVCVGDAAPDDGRLAIAAVVLEHADDRPPAAEELWRF